jgi:hypothetical protein
MRTNGPNPAPPGGTFFSPRAGTNRGRAIILAGILGVLLGIGLIRLDVGLTRGGIGGAPLGYVVAPVGPFGDDRSLYVLTAAPGSPSVSMFSLRNKGALPIRIEGVVVGEDYDDLVVGHWTALWVPPGGPGFDAPGLEAIRPFEPVTLQPGDELQVYAGGVAGACAYGPTFDPTTEDQPDYAGMSQIGPEITVAYSVFGLASMAQIDIGETFGEPSRNGCVGG